MLKYRQIDDTNWIGKGNGSLCVYILYRNAVF